MNGFIKQAVSDAKVGGFYQLKDDYVTSEILRNALLKGRRENIIFQLNSLQIN